METWTDQALCLSARAHGEGGAIIKLFTSEFGLHAGYLYNASAGTKRAIIEPGNILHAQWNAKVDSQLGTYTLEIEQQLAPLIMADRIKIAALQAACSLLDSALPEREKHADLYHATYALYTILAHSEDDVAAWGEAYIKWEIALLRELGFSLDLSRCAGGGGAQTLAYVSPKSGCAVSYEKGEAYKERLLPLPAFLKPNAAPCDAEEFSKGLVMTGAFLKKWVFAQHTQGVPNARTALEELCTPAADLERDKIASH